MAYREHGVCMVYGYTLLYSEALLWLVLGDWSLCEHNEILWSAVWSLTLPCLLGILGDAFPSVLTEKSHRGARIGFGTFPVVLFAWDPSTVIVLVWLNPLPDPFQVSFFQSVTFCLLWLHEVNHTDYSFHCTEVWFDLFHSLPNFHQWAITELLWTAWF